MNMGFFSTYETSKKITDKLLNDYFHNVACKYATYKGAVTCVDTYKWEMLYLLGDPDSITKWVNESENITLFTQDDFSEGITYLRTRFGIFWQPKQSDTSDFKDKVYGTLFPDLKRTADNDEKVLRTIKNHSEFVNNHKECYKAENKTFRDELTGMLNLVSSATNKQILVALKKDAEERAKMLHYLNEAMKPEFLPVDSLPDAVKDAVAYIHYLSVNLEAANAQVKELTETMHKLSNIIYDATENRKE